MLKSRDILSTQSDYIKRLCYFVKNWYILSTKHANLSKQMRVLICPNSVIMFKFYVIMLFVRAFLSTQSLVMLKCYLIMFKNGLSYLRSMWIYL